MSAKGISQTSSGEAATWERSAECERENSVRPGGVSIVARFFPGKWNANTCKARNRQENAAHGRSRGSLSPELSKPPRKERKKCYAGRRPGNSIVLEFSAAFVRGNCGPAYMTLKLFCDRVEVCSRRKCKTQPATDALEKTAGLGH